MNLKFVVVDELPENCEKCDFERFDGNVGCFCAITNECLYKINHLDHNKRHSTCPLITDCELEHDTKDLF